MDIELKGQITTITAQPVSIELSRGQKGSYGWTIKVHAATTEETIQQVNTIDTNLRKVYGAPIAQPE
jgi:hypothetical protein